MLSCGNPMDKFALKSHGRCEQAPAERSLRYMGYLIPYHPATVSSKGIRPQEDFLLALRSNRIHTPALGRAHSIKNKD